MSAPSSPARCLAVLGTGSDVGKSIVVTALCRIFSDMGIRVAPFKAQNMSNNSFVTAVGGEIGRAQAVQAEAARAEMHVDMNPVLLKPCTDTGAQVVLLGRPLGTMEARAYYANNRPLLEASTAALERLRAQYEMVVMEGAGSCAEVNLRERDFVNFEMAHASDAPVILTADIDRGGVFAQVIGTLAVIPPRDKARIRGILINRFRGDLSLFSDGVTYLEKQTGLPVLGVIPHFYHIDIDSEDGMPLETVIDPAGPLDSARINIAVIRLPHISNFTDFNPLIREPKVTLHYLSKPRDLLGYDALILPGSKNVRFDLEWMRKVGFDREVLRFSALGKPTVGICGGYQLLGGRIDDPLGVEGRPGSEDGLGLLDIATVFHKEKKLRRVSGVLLADETPVFGYEIHMGVSVLGSDATPLLRLENNGDPAGDADNGEADGASNADGTVWGTYLHGVFDDAAFRHWFLKSIRPREDWGGEASEDRALRHRDGQYDLLARHFTEHLDLDGLFNMMEWTPSTIKGQ